MKKIALSALALGLPYVAFAQANVNNIQDLGAFVINIINNIAVPVVFAVAFIVFIWGVFKYFILGGHDEEARGSGKDLMLYGLIGFFVMVSVWGLVNILVNSVRLNNVQPQVNPVQNNVRNY